LKGSGGVAVTYMRGPLSQLGRLNDLIKGPIENAHSRMKRPVSKSRALLTCRYKMPVKNTLNPSKSKSLRNFPYRQRQT